MPFRCTIDAINVTHCESQAIPVTSHLARDHDDLANGALSPRDLNQTHVKTGIRLVKQHILLDERVLNAATKYHNLSVAVPHGMKLKGKRFVTLHAHGGKKIHLSAKQFDQLLQLWGERQLPWIACP